MRKGLALFFFIFLLFVAYWADTGTMPDILKTAYAFPNGDRLGHVVLYGMLAYLLTVAFPYRRVRVGAWSFSLGVVLALGMATLEEFSQLFIVTRTPDLIDLIAGYLGIYLSTWIPCMGGVCVPIIKPETKG